MRRVSYRDLKKNDRILKNYILKRQVDTNLEIKELRSKIKALAAIILILAIGVMLCLVI